MWTDLMDTKYYEKVMPIYLTTFMWNGKNTLKNTRSVKRRKKMWIFWYWINNKKFSPDGSLINSIKLLMMK